MLSTFAFGSKQYLVRLGSIIKVEKMNVKKGDVWTSDQVLLFQNEKGELAIGQPSVQKAQVKGRIIRHGKHKKILMIKKKRRKGYRRTQGHRQQFTELQIVGLADEKGVWHNYAPAKKQSSGVKANKSKPKDSKTPSKKGVVKKAKKQS